MSTREDCSRCTGDTESSCECVKCGKCPRRLNRKSTYSVIEKTGDSARISAKQIESHYVTHIVSAGIRTSDNIYEAKLILAPEVDTASVKITVKNKNLRIVVHRPLGELAKRLPLSIHEKSPLNELVKRTTKHCENFLIPESIDGDKVRAIIDNKNRILVLTAPPIKPCKALRRRFSMMAGMKVEGLKIGPASLVSDHVLNMKLHEPGGFPCNVRNINFLIPREADARQVSVEVFNGNEIFIRAPIRKKTHQSAHSLSHIAYNKNSHNDDNKKQ